MSYLKRYFFESLPVFKIILSLIWLCNLSRTDAYFSVYVLIAFVSLYLQIGRASENGSKKQDNLLTVSLAVIFSILVYLANYPLFFTIGDPALIGHGTSVMVNLIDSVFSLLGGVFVFYPILQFALLRLPLDFDPKKFQCGITSRVSICIFLSFVCVNLVHLFLVEYPGNVTEDPFTQISEMVSGSYSNFNTYWHTMLLRLALSAGNTLFADGNASVACFCVFQILLVSFAFTYCLVTLSDYGIPGWALLVTFAVYAFLPYNIALSITVWKDVPFAAGYLLFLSSFLRIIRKMGKIPFLDYIVFIFGSLVFFISRTNSWIIYGITLFAVLLVPSVGHRLKITMGIMAVFGWFLLNPALSMMQIPQGDRVESLSIPIQQVARVIADGCDLTDNEKQLLSQVVDLDVVVDEYMNWISDPIKREIRNTNPNFFEDHFLEFRDLWIQLGARYPVQYLKAWVDQTKGYWNGGYPYAMYSETITDNPYGIEKTGAVKPVAALFRVYFGLSRHVILFEPLHSIGLHVWIVFLCFVVNLRKKREESLLSVPLLLLVLGLCFGTPVYCSFRYIYPLFVCFPLILGTAVFSRK